MQTICLEDKSGHLNSLLLAINIHHMIYHSPCNQLECGVFVPSDCSCGCRRAVSRWTEADSHPDADVRVLPRVVLGFTFDGPLGEHDVCGKNSRRTRHLWCMFPFYPSKVHLHWAKTNAKAISFLWYLSLVNGNIFWTFLKAMSLWLSL